MMDHRHRIAGVVVLFHPPKEVAENIRSYAPFLQKLIMIDNSPTESPELRNLNAGSVESEYLFPGRNMGMAGALNLAASMAIRDGFEWLLTMDQDSRFAEGDFTRLVSLAANHLEAGILSPRHVLGKDDSDDAKHGLEKVPVAMTSGNLLNLAAYSKAGPFHEPLFIDYVDYEYCLRLADRGFPVLRCNDVVLKHSLGEIREERRLGLVFRPTHHSYIRRYYMTRNRLYVMFRYKRILIPEVFAWAKEIVKLLLFEEGKAGKLKFMARGAFDFLRNRYGPIGQ